MTRREFRVEVGGGSLMGWVGGAGPAVLLLHGGPGMSARYMDGLIAELSSGYEVAIYQQRGLPPSMEEGPFTIATQIDDIRSVLDALNWDKAYVVGHSFGGHLALHAAVNLADRLAGLLSIDAAGGVGDGGMAGYEANIMGRVPAARPRLEELEQLDKRGELTRADSYEGFTLLWPGYFAVPSDAPPAPGIDDLSPVALSRGFESMFENIGLLEAKLPTVTVPAGFVVGEKSPMPADLASTATARRMPNAWVEVVPNAGHFIWMEAPGAVRQALDRLVSLTE